MNVVVVYRSSVYQTVMEAALEPLGVSIVGWFSHETFSLDSDVLRDVGMVLVEETRDLNMSLSFIEALTQRFPAINLVFITPNKESHAGYLKRTHLNGKLIFIQNPLFDTFDMKVIYLRKQIQKYIQPSALPKPKPGEKWPLFNTQKAASQAQNRHYGVLVIGISTGGPAALDKFFSALSSQVTVPIVIAQHMPPSFTSSLASHLRKVTRFDVHEAQSDEELVPGKILIGRGGQHVTLHRNKATGKVLTRISENTSQERYTPSIDFLFRSAADAYMGKVLCFVGSGLGNDGTRGAHYVKTHGGYCVAQSLESAPVFSMPKSIIDSNLADEVLDMTSFAHRVPGLLGMGDLHEH